MAEVTYPSIAYAYSPMVSDGSPYDVDRPRGIFGRRDREYLLDELDVEPRTQRDREIRSDLRERMWNGMLDMILLYEHVEQRDIEQALANVDGEERMRRDEAIVNMISLFLDISAGKELADASDFERFVERAAAASWYDRYVSDNSGTVWLGEPNAELTIDFPDRIELNELIAKISRVWRRIRNMDEFTGAEVEGGPSTGGLGEQLGLHTLSADEVLYLVSMVQLDDVAEDSETRDPGVKIMREVAQTWLLWKQYNRENVTPKALKKLTDAHREEEAQLLEQLKQSARDDLEE